MVLDERTDKRIQEHRLAGTRQATYQQMRQPRKIAGDNFSIRHLSEYDRQRHILGFGLARAIEHVEHYIMVRQVLPSLKRQANLNRHNPIVRFDNPNRIAADFL